MGILDASKFAFRHHCGEWSEPWLSLYIGSNLIICACYLLLLPLALTLLLRHGGSIRIGEAKQELLLFSSFIALCGGGHLLDGVGAFVWPAYEFFACWHSGTALVSMATVFVLFFKSIRIIRD